MNLKKWWGKRKYWQRGALLGGIVGLIFIITALTSDPPSYERLLEILGFMLILYIIPLVLFGAFIGFLSSLIKNKFIFIGGIVGLIVGLLSILLFEIKKIVEIILYPLMILNKFVLHIEGPIGEGAGPLFILFNIFLWILIGLIIGFAIYLIKKRFNK